LAFHLPLCFVFGFLEHSAYFVRKKLFFSMLLRKKAEDLLSCLLILFCTIGKALTIPWRRAAGRPSRRQAKILGDRPKQYNYLCNKIIGGLILIRIFVAS